MLSVLLALAAAVFNAASNVLQRRANLDQPEEGRFSVRLIGHLLRRKVWLAGLLAVVISFLLQAAALGAGQLAVVQPLIILELPLTLIAASRLLGRPMHRREWAATGLLTAGVVGLLISLDAHAPTTQVPPDATWLWGLLATYGTIGLLVPVGSRTSGGRRAAVYGAATGIDFGVTAALMKEMTTAFSTGGLTGALTSWSTYLMIASGLLGMLLLQNALQSGPLVVAQPGITLLDPVVAVLWGVLAFGEQVNGGIVVVAQVASGLALAWGTFQLARSPGLLDGDQGATPDGQTDGQRPSSPTSEKAARPGTRPRREPTVGVGN